MNDSPIQVSQMSIDSAIPRGYASLITSIKSKIRSASIKAAYKVNSEMINLYFEIGKDLVNRIEINQKNGSKFNIIKQASIDLINEFGKGEGYSERNLNYMVKLYNTYKDSDELQRVIAVVPWGSNCEILDANLSLSEQEFYLRYTANSGCTRPILKAQIQTKLFERDRVVVLNNFDSTIPEHSEQAKELIRDSYILQVIDPSNKIHERQLENQIIQNIKDFLLELGSGFAYIGNQYRVNLGDEANFIDLLFFNRELQCLFAIDLKMTEFIPEFIGKMQYYLELLDTQIKLPHENPSIGIILCTSKNQLKVESTLKRSTSPIAVATYELVARLQKKLPELISIKEGWKTTDSDW